MRSSTLVKPLAILAFALLLSNAPFLFQRAEAADTTIDSSVSTAGTSHAHMESQTVFISDQTGYKFYRDSNGACVYSKTTDGGASWGAAVTVDSQTDCINIAVWYDQWTPGDSGSVIHIVTMDTTSDSLFYNAVDTGNADARLAGTTAVDTDGGTQIATNAAGANYPSITKATDGTVYIAETDASDSFVLSCSANCDTTGGWSEVGTNPFELAAETQLLLPLAGGDILAIENDTSASDILSKVWDGSNWSASFTTVDSNAIDNTTYDQNMDATLNPSTGDIYLAYVADDATPGTDDDIRTAVYSGGAWTSKTNVVTNSACGGVANCGITAVSIALDSNTGDVYVAYTAETTAGTITSQSSFWKESTDGMNTWGSEQGPLNTDASDDTYGIDLNPINDARIFASWDVQATDDMMGTTLATLSQVADTSVSRSFHLFGGFVIKLISGKLKLLGH